ncbi:hypothetical protein T492DRAFT_1053756 [Pavlovales sp. CCMP2436]|nr:hypothetical protein T492DRAFT_1053756 [Pavlovales sp. CCMP2436]
MWGPDLRPRAIPREPFALSAGQAVCRVRRADGRTVVQVALLLSLAYPLAEAATRPTVRRGTRAEIFSRARSPLSLLRPSDFLIAEDAGEIVGFLQSASIGAGFLFLADDQELASFEADDDDVHMLCALSKQALKKLPVGKRLWWFGSSPGGASEAALLSAGFEPATLAQTAQALWPGLIFFGTPIFLLPALVFAFPLLPQGLAFVDEASSATRVAIALSPSVITVALAAQAVLGKAVLCGGGTAARRRR